MAKEWGTGIAMMQNTVAAGLASCRGTALFSKIFYIIGRSVARRTWNRKGVEDTFLYVKLWTESEAADSKPCNDDKFYKQYGKEWVSKKAKENLIELYRKM